MKPYYSLSNIAIAMLLLLTAPVTNADKFTGHIGGFIGTKILNGGDWPDLNIHNSLGILFDIKKDSWPISIVLEVMDTGGEHKDAGMKDLGHTTEYHVGVRKIFMSQQVKIQPYIGGGVSFMSAELEIEVNNITTIQDDTNVGGWFGAGMYYEVNPGFVLGLDVRYSHGEVILFNKDRDAGGVYLGVTGGFQF